MPQIIPLKDQIISPEEKKRIADSMFAQLNAIQKTMWYVGAHKYGYGVAKVDDREMVFVSFKASGKNYKKGLYIYIFYDSGSDEYIVEGIVTINYNSKIVGRYSGVQASDLREFIEKITDGEPVAPVYLKPLNGIVKRPKFIVKKAEPIKEGDKVVFANRKALTGVVIKVKDDDVLTVEWQDSEGKLVPIGRKKVFDVSVKDVRLEDEKMDGVDFGIKMEKGGGINKISDALNSLDDEILLNSANGAGYAPKLLEEVKGWMKRLEDRLKLAYNPSDDTFTIYRHQIVDDEFLGRLKNGEIKHLGRYWAYKAKAYSWNDTDSNDPYKYDFNNGNRKNEIKFEAKVKFDDVDFQRTADHYAIEWGNTVEYELHLKDEAKIILQKAYYKPYGHSYKPVEISGNFILEKGGEIIAYYNSHGYKADWSEIRETEIERGNYTDAQFDEWEKKYDIKPNDKAIWVTPSKRHAYAYMDEVEQHDKIMAMSDEKLEKYAKRKLGYPYEYSADAGVIITESDDGDNGFLLVLKQKYADGGSVGMKQIDEVLGRALRGERPLAHKYRAFIKEGKLGLFHYHHLLLVYDLATKKPDYTWHETPTDKRGLDAAIEYLDKAEIKLATGGSFTEEKSGKTEEKYEKGGQVSGKTLTLFHYTSSLNNFRKFKIADNDIGIHFGTKEQAIDRMRITNRMNDAENPRIIEAYISISNPLELPDLGLWDDAENILSNIQLSEKLSEAQMDYLIEYTLGVPRKMYIQRLREGLIKLGFDGIKYVNEVEADGSNEYSYIVFTPNQIKIRQTLKLLDDGGLVDDIYTHEKIKKGYVSIRIKYSSERNITNQTNTIKFTDEKVFSQLKNLKLDGIDGISSSNYNVSEWLIHRECMIVMPFQQLRQLNTLEQVKYYDADYLTADGMEVMFRLYQRSERTDRDYYSILQNILPKIAGEFMMEADTKVNPSEVSKFYSLKDIYDVYQSGKFLDYLSKSKRISSPEDMAQLTVDYILSGKMKADNYYVRIPESITVAEIIDPIKQGISYCGAIYREESEWRVKDKSLKIPDGSQIFFVLTGYENMRAEYEKMVEKYELRKHYTVNYIPYKRLENFQQVRFNMQRQRYEQDAEEAKGVVDKKMYKALDEIRQEMLADIEPKIKEEIIGNIGSERYHNEDGEEFGDDIFEVPVFKITYNNIILKFNELFNAQVSNIVKGKNKYYIETAIRAFNNYLEDLESKQGGIDSGIMDNWGKKIFFYDFLHPFTRNFYNLNYMPYQDKIKEKVGADLFRYFSKKDMMMEVGGLLHGSSSTEPFKKFSIQKAGQLGTDFGWGLYFTSESKIAKFYANQSIRKNAHWVYDKHESSEMNKPLFDLLVENIYDIPDTRKAVDATKYSDKQKQEMLSLLDSYEEELSSGVIYNITLFKGKKEGEYNWLVWHEPVPAKYRKAIIEKARDRGLVNGAKDEKYLNNNFDSGEDILEWLKEAFVEKKRIANDLKNKTASLFLHSVGIDGIKYRCGTKTPFAYPDGCYNYVVFDADAVTIDGVADRYARGGAISRNNMLDKSAYGNGTQDFNLSEISNLPAGWGASVTVHHVLKNAFQYSNEKVKVRVQLYSDGNENKISVSIVPVKQLHFFIDDIQTNNATEANEAALEMMRKYERGDYTERIEGYKEWVSDFRKLDSSVEELRFATGGGVKHDKKPDNNFEKLQTSDVENIIYSEAEKIRHLECDGAVRVLDYALSKNNVPHYVFSGKVTLNGNIIPLHFWIGLPDGRLVDYKARMWLGDAAPNGIFFPADVSAVYDGKVVEMNTTEMVYNILTLEI